MPNMSSKDNWKSQSFFVTSFANKYLIYVFSSLSSRNETLPMRFTEVCGNRGNIIRRNIIRLINWNRIYIGLFIYKDLLLNKS